MGKAKKSTPIIGVSPEQLGAVPGSRVIRIEYVDLDDLGEHRAARNAKKHRLDELDASMRRHGYAAPVMIDEGTQSVVAGHGRIDTLMQRRLAGREAPDGVHVRDGRWLVPVVRGIQFKDPVEAMSYLLADNQIQMLASYDWHELGEIAKLVADSSEGLIGTGFVDLGEIEAQMEREVKDLLGSAGDDGGGAGNGAPPGLGGDIPESKYKEQYGVIVVCADASDQEQVYEALKAQGYNCKVVVT